MEPKVTRYYGNDLFVEGSHKPGRQGFVRRMNASPDPRCVAVVMQDLGGNELQWFPSVNAAAAYAGITQSTMSQWIRRGLVRGERRWVYENGGRKGYGP